MPTRSIGHLALVLVVLFLTIVAGSLLPLKPLDSAWQWQLATTLLNSAPLPLLALALLQIGVLLDPGNAWLRERRQTFAQFAVLAAIGYLLLMPLQFSAGLRQQLAISSGQSGRVAAAAKQLAAIRQAVDQAGSADDLVARLGRISGPTLSAADRSKPLPLLKSQLHQALDQLQSKLDHERAALPATPAGVLVSDLIRNAIAGLTIASGFAAFARRPGHDFSVLEEIQAGFWRLRYRQQTWRESKDGRISHEEYLRQLHDPNP